MILVQDNDPGIGIELLVEGYLGMKHDLSDDGNVTFNK